MWVTTSSWYVNHPDSCQEFGLEYGDTKMERIKNPREEPMTWRDFSYQWWKNEAQPKPNMSQTPKMLINVLLYVFFSWDHFRLTNIFMWSRFDSSNKDFSSDLNRDMTSTHPFPQCWHLTTVFICSAQAVNPASNKPISMCKNTFTADRHFTVL